MLELFGFRLTVLFTLTWLLIAFANATSKVEFLVKTLNGVVKGYKDHSPHGQNFYAFRGIKFAETTAGENRFRPPVSKKPWQGIYDASHDGPTCPQNNPLANLSSISEDCLALNIFTKNFVAEQPVMVLFYGGANSGDDAQTDPDYLFDKANIVFVVAHFRVGVLGFSNTADSNSPGNAGFKDQTLALLWVRDNIRTFGGNPNLITIVGESVGSVSVTAHVVSPLSNGLFHRAIGQSGSFLSNHVNNTYYTYETAKNLGCSVESSDVLIRCAQEKSYEDVLRAADFGMSMAWGFQPENPAVGAFLTEDPTIPLQEGRFNRVPLIIGFTFNEAGDDGKTPPPGIELFADLARKYTDVYYYTFSFLGRYTKGKSDSDGKPLGVYHGDDLQYLFTGKNFPLFGDSAPEHVIVEKLTGWWTSFANTGNPNNPQDPWTFAREWSPSNSSQLYNFNIT